MTKQNNYLGIDLGSSYTKFAVIDDVGNLVNTQVLPTLSRRIERYEQVVDNLHNSYSIQAVCTTGYGRNTKQSDLQKTELICASAGVTHSEPLRKGIIDIGGEDIKIIESGPNGEVIHFHMNDKCSAGTGAFITEIAEKAELEISEMNELAQASTTDRIINSFCTVFAKTEILGWIFNGTPIEDIAKGIYLSITDRICKMPIPSAIPILLCGGVITYHPILQQILQAKLGIAVRIASQPLYSVALGAALLAKKNIPANKTYARPS